MALSADGKWIAAAWQSDDATRRVVEIYPCKTGSHLRDLKADRTFGPFTADPEQIWFAAGGRELIVARADRTVIAIDATSGKELRRATPPRWSVIAASPDGKSVAFIPRHMKNNDVWHVGYPTVRVWDLTTDKEVWELPRPGIAISGVAYTPDGKHLVTSDGEFEFRKWDLATGKEVEPRRAWTGIGVMSAVVVSADGKRYATARDWTGIKLWNAETGEHLNPLPTHRDAVAGTAVSPDSRLVATVGYDGTMRVWHAASGKPVCTAAAPRVDPQDRDYGTRRSVAFTPDGRGVVFDAAGVLVMADATTGKPLDLPGGLKGLSSTCGRFSADGKTLVTFSGDTTTLWDWPAGTARRTFRTTLDEKKRRTAEQLAPDTAGAVLSPDGGTLLIISDLTQKGSNGGNSNDCWDVTNRWDVTTGKLRYRFAPDLWHPRVVFSPDGRTFYAGGQPSAPDQDHDRLRRDGLAAWDVATGTIIRRFDDPVPSARHVGALALSPDGRLLAVIEGDDSHVWIHETASGRVVRHFDGHTRFIYDVAFAPDGSKLVSTSSDHTGLVWDVALRTFTDRKAGPLTPKELTDSWGRLAAPDPVLGWRAVADLAGSPTEAVAFLADHLKPLPAPTAADLDRIEKQLAAPGFEDREKAGAELDAFGPTAVAAVKARQRTTESLEVARRFTEFLKKHAGERPSPLTLRGARGVLVLETIGSPDARKVLAGLAKSPDDSIGSEAAAALVRMKKSGDQK